MLGNVALDRDGRCEPSGRFIEASGLRQQNAQQVRHRQSRASKADKRLVQPSKRCKRLHAAPPPDILPLHAEPILDANQETSRSRRHPMAITSRTLTRDVVTPVTIVTFVVSTVTGIMLLGHWNAGLVRVSHEWLSVVFSAIALWHLVKNWRGFTGYLKRNTALAAFAISLVLSVVVTGMTGTTGSGSVNPGAVFGALSGASLAIAAPALGLTPDGAVAVLKAANIDADPDDSLTAIGARARLSGAAVASLLAAKRPH